MNATVRQLFFELMDLPADDRQRILTDRGIPAGIRAELESLLQFDTQRDQFTHRMCEAMEEALASGIEYPKCGPYRLVRLIGAGGMGAVYLANREDGEVDQQVAIKLLRADADRPEWRERFLRERQVLASLNHSSIARLMDAGHTADGRPYLVMEFVDGVPVDEYASALDLRGRLELFVQVCGAVSYAHDQSIIHRDLKPSNILVDGSGTPRLLDFGIAKVLGHTANQTRTVDRLLTPTYASPEQLRGGDQNVATDIYSLGAVLYKLLTGRVPRESIVPDPPADWDENVVPPSRLDRAIPKDLDYIVLKALRSEPFARYATVQALADDVRRVLDSRPVHARAGNTAYRLAKFLRRNRAAAGTALAVASFFAAMVSAKQQHDSAQGRIDQGRRLASRVLALNESAGNLHGSSKASYELVKLSKDYLEGLSPEARNDPRLALELGRAYSLLARAQGITLDVVGGNAGEARDSLIKAGALVEPVLRSHPRDREALRAAASVSHDQMVVAETQHRNEEALAQACKAVDYLERLLEPGGLPVSYTEMAADYYYQIALTHKNLQRIDEGIRHSRRSIEIARTLPDGAFRVSLGLSILADLLRLTGKLEEALQAIREARNLLQHASFPNDMTRRSSEITVRWREGKILGVANGLGLNRPAEAIPVFQEAFDLVEDWVRNDPGGAWNRLFFASIGRELGELLRDESPQRAISVYDHSLLRLREVPENTEARRGEAVLLAASSHALRRLGRNGEAERRIESAFQLLRELGEYPTPAAGPNPAVESALRALGDHLAETGDLPRAEQVFTDLLGRISRPMSEPRNDLRHAVALSHIYGSLATVYRRDLLPERAAVLEERRLALWRDWKHKLPGTPWIDRQLKLAGAGL